MRLPRNALRGKVALLTEGSQGAGLACALKLAQAGAALVLCGPTLPAVESLYQQLEQVPGVELLGAACDGRELAALREVRDQALQRFGHIDIWINSVARPSAPVPTHEITAPQWRAVLESHLLSAFHGTQLALEHMLRRNEGHIITLIDPTPERATGYQTAQAGLEAFTTSVAAEYRTTDLSILGLRLPPRLPLEQPTLTPELLEVGEVLCHLVGLQDGRRRANVIVEVESGWWRRLRGLWGG